MIHEIFWEVVDLNTGLAQRCLRDCPSWRWGGGTKPICYSVIFQFFGITETLCYLLKSTLIFGRCGHSFTVATPAKYQWDSDDLTSNFAKLDIYIQ